VSHSAEQLDSLMAAIVRGDSTRAVDLAACGIERVRRAASEHGVLPLLAERLRGAAPVAADLVGALEADLRHGIASDLRREVDLRQTLAACHRRGLDVLVLKGAALAYTHYPRSDLRPRVDTDLLIPEDRRSDAHETLTALGFRRPEQVTGQLVMSQAMYEKRRDGVVLHAIDLHWRIANPQLFSGVLTFEELDRRAVPIPALGPSARGLAGPDALVLACVHRVAHHRDDDSLIWLYDIHLVASALTEEEWRTFRALAAERGVLTICRQGLARAAARFRTVIPPDVVEGHEAETARTDEGTAAFLRRGRPQLNTLISDLGALRSWTARGRLLREHLFPPASYMRGAYAPSSRAPLAALYAWRAARGAWRWLRRG
jgi:hypothetical protein